MTLTLAVCLTPCHIVTIMSLVHIPIVQERQGLQLVLPDVNQVGDSSYNCTALTHIVCKVMTQVMRRISILGKKFILYLQECQKFRLR